MVMFLLGVPTIVIMNIREHVERFTFGVSKKMIRLEYFHTLNAEQNQDQEKFEKNNYRRQG